MKIKKSIALITATIFAGLSVDVFPVWASSEGVTVIVESPSYTLSELEKMQYQVPVYIRITENAGLTSAEFGIRVDERCSYRIVTSSSLAREIGGEYLNWDMTSASSGNLSWLTWASNAFTADTGNLTLLYVQLPETAQPGDVYAVDYLSGIVKAHIWSCRADEDGNWLEKRIDYVAEGTVDWQSGCIRVVEETTEESSSSFPESLTLRVGEAAVLELPDCSDPQSVTWISGNGGVASVEEGRVTALAEGTSVIYALYNGMYNTCTLTVQGAELVKGDVNGDGSVNVLDIVMINRTLLGSCTLDSGQRTAADVDGDGQLTASDALMLMQYTVKLIDTLS